MKITIPKRIRKYLLIYIALLVLLYIVIEFIPRVTTVFETTEILEPGELQITCRAEGYFVKTEAIATANTAGKVVYRVKDGTIVGKDRKVVNIQAMEKTEGLSRKFADLMTRLEGYSGVYPGGKTPISGIYSLSMDGCEKDLNPENLDALTHDQLKGMQMSPKSLEQESVLAGEPIFKITSDNRWYLVCWMSEDDAAGYTEGQQVSLELPAGSARAKVRSITQQGKEYKVIFSSNMYYPDLSSSREADVTIVNSDTSGLLVSNCCIIEKKGQQGVYVRNKNGEYHFVPVNIINTDGERSVVSETSFYNAEGKMISTVSVYDEVLKSPAKALKKELKEEEKKAREEEKEAEEKARREKERREQLEKQTTSETKKEETSRTQPAQTTTQAATQQTTQTAPPAETTQTVQPETTQPTQAPQVTETTQAQTVGQ